MNELKQQIMKYASVISGDVLNLDSILNHQVDPQFVMLMGRELANHYKNEGVTRVLTVESSGISIAFAVALELGVPLVFARRKKSPTTGSNAYSERVPSFTKGIVTDIIVSEEFLQPDDRVLLIDDIIANGDAARGLIRIINRSEATLVGLGIVVEKSFQAGGRTIREQGVRVESLVKIASLTDGQIEFE